jgi:TRAP-type C4-dicarboxylate transport system permease large subunit
MAELPKHDRRSEAIGAGGIGLLVLVTLGGLWGGLFTATEAAAVGMFGGYILGWAKGMTWREMWRATVDAGPLVAPIMILIIAAQMYSKLLAFEGTTDWLKTVMDSMNIGAFAALGAMVVLWLILGTLLDSMSTLLLSVPIFWPIAQAYAIDPLVFCIIGILVIEAGILTPPLGMAVFIVKACVPEPVPLNEIYRGAVPYCVLTLLLAAVLIAFPFLVTGPVALIGPK